jgi:hypothetical protein
MPLRDVFLNEGERDAANRQQAVEIYRKYVEALRSGKYIFRLGALDVRNLGYDDPAPGTRLIIRAKPNVSVSDIPGGARLARSDAAAYRAFTDGLGGGRIDITIDMDPELMDQLPLSLVNFIIGDSETASAVIHELVHYLDSFRIPADDWKRGLENTFDRDQSGEPTLDVNRYNQSPIEQNAQFQEAAELATRMWTPDQVRSMGIDEFYRSFVDLLQRYGGVRFDLYRKRQIPHVKKRVAQLYQDIIGSG